jgi:cytochrome c oxidase assembly protein subunit 15
MDTIPTPRRDKFIGGLTVAFGTTVGLWSVAYLGRLPTVMLSAPLLVGILILVLMFGGYLAGRKLGEGASSGAMVGFFTGLINLLVLGSLLSGESPNQIVPSALLWIPGSMLGSAAVAALGGAFATAPGVPMTGREWLGLYAKITVAATMLLLAVGGLVTSQEMGLAVVDWPNSYGYNMFLFPLSRMTAGIYFEHAHRLFGALVGLTVVVFSFLAWRLEPRPAVRRTIALVLGMVILQGILGGLRVTGRFTMDMPDDLEPNIVMAIIHGVFAQIIFITLVAVAAVTSKTWLEGPPAEKVEGAGAVRIFGPIVVVLLVGQLILGAILRHTETLLLVHAAGGVFVAPLAITLGFRAWGRFWEDKLLQRLGIGLVLITGTQIFLGLGAFLAIGGVGGDRAPLPVEVALTTTHQWMGAMVLGSATLLVAWTKRRTR